MPAAESSKRRINVAVACNACRQRKAGCDGERPTCRPCEVRGTVCEYKSLDSHETHTGVLRRRQAETNAQLEDYHKLFQTLQCNAPAEALRVLTLLRSGADVFSVGRRIEGSGIANQPALAPDGHLRYAFPYRSNMPWALLGNRRNPYLTSRILHATLEPSVLPHAPPAGDKKIHPAFLLPYHTVSLLEPTLEHIKADPWTNVVHDDNMVRKLLKVYLLHEYPYLTFFDKDSFLHDMSAGRHEYCSPLLVNAILACAAHGERDSHDRADYWLPETWSYKFAAEARRLWDLECTHPTLTTIQAGLVMSVTYSMDGNNMIGCQYLNRVVEMARENGLLSHIDDTLPSRRRSSRLITAWGLFIWQAIMSFHLHRAPLLKHPPSDSLADEGGIRGAIGQVWVQYPLARDRVDLHHSSTFKALAEFSLILNDLARQAFASSSGLTKLSPEDALMYRKRLLDWLADLPEPLTADEIVFPSHLKLHMHYHHVMLVLFLKPFAADNQLGEALPDTIPPRAYPHDIVTQAKTSLETLMRLYYLRHGFETWDSMMPLFISSVGHTALEDLATSPDPETRREILSTMILCIKGLYDQGKSMYVSEVVYRLLRGSLASEDERLVREFAGVPEHDEQERAKLMLQHVHSAWPIGNAHIGEDVEEKRINSLVRKAAEKNLSIQRQTE